MSFHFLTEIEYQKHKKHPALLISNEATSYEHFLEGASRIVSFLKHYIKKQSFCLVISEKTTFFYQMVMGCFLGRIIYVPLNIDAGLLRNLKMIETVKEAVLFLGDVCDKKIIDIVSALKNRIIIVKNPLLYSRLKVLYKQNRYILYREKDFYPNIKKIKINNDDIAYLLFTSGSTGKPKAVPITYGNLNAYVKSFLALFPVSQEDRFSQISDIGFDISIHEMVICWVAGATLCVYDEKKFLTLSHFIQQYAITQLILIPSLLNQLIMQHHYFKSSFSTVKRTIACGEPFPLSYAERWKNISFNSSIINFYGPTEATISCLYHCYDQKNDYPVETNTLPIGFPFPGTDAYLSSDNELILSGEQVSSGYLFLNALSIKNKNFFKNEHNHYSYATGDHVNFHPQFGFIFLGRFDDQWQVRGYRVEKNEVENIIRKITGCDEIYVAPYFNAEGLVEHLCSFSINYIDFNVYRDSLNKALPVFGCPKNHYFLKEIPRLSNGKVNYHALINYQEII